jgi:hypothetical protein
MVKGVPSHERTGVWPSVPRDDVASGLYITCERVAMGVVHVVYVPPHSPTSAHFGRFA